MADSFHKVVSEAINDIITHGFDHVSRLEFWVAKIKKAALANLIPESVLQATLKETLKTIYVNMIDKGGILKYHPGVGKYTVAKLKPAMRAELDRRISLSANLIKLNREQSIAATLQRFTGWATSIPTGGTDVVQRAATKAYIKKSLSSLTFEERRVAIDQGMKFTSALNSLIAKENNAIAGIWHSHWKRPGYNYREDHKERDLKIYAVRDNWAIKAGLMKVGPDGYTDEITRPAEEVYCSCYYQYVYSIEDLPPSMVTKKGAEQLAALKQ